MAWLELKLSLQHYNSSQSRFSLPILMQFYRLHI